VRKREKLRKSGEAYSVATVETSGGEEEMGEEVEAGRRGEWKGDERQRLGVVTRGRAAAGIER
jgi:hypothetical protein